MNDLSYYTLICIMVIVAIAIIFLIKPRRAPNRLSLLSLLSIAIVIISFIVSDRERLGYGLMIMAIVFALVDLVRKFRENSSL